MAIEDFDDAAASVEALAAEQGAQIDSPSSIESAKELLVEALPGAMMTISHIAQYGENDRDRLAAAKYIVDKSLGTDAIGAFAGREDPLDRMLRALADQEA